MNSRTKKFLSYYKPYLGLFFTDMACAFIVSAIALTLPLCARYITKNVLEADGPNILPQIYIRRMNTALWKSAQRIADVNAQVEDTLSGIRVVKSFTNEEIEKKKFAYENDRFLNSRIEGYRSEAYFTGGMIAFTQLITISVIIYGGVRMVNGALDLADLLTCLLYVGMLGESIRNLVNFGRLYQEGLTGFNRFMEMLEVAPDSQDSANAIELTHVQGNVEFKQVSFKYKEGNDYVLKNICLKIKAEEYVALVGASGGGKTTLCSLIPRFYEVSEGEILIVSTNCQEPLTA